MKLEVDVVVYAQNDDYMLCSFKNCDYFSENLYFIANKQNNTINTWEIGQGPILEVWNEWTDDCLDYLEALDDKEVAK